MAPQNGTIPSFLAPVSHPIEVGGHALTFHPVSASMLLKLKPVTASIARLIDAFVSHGANLFAAPAVEARQSALAQLLSAVQAEPYLIGMLVMDALHDEKWVKRPVQQKDAEQLLERIDGPSLAAMFGAIVAVNREAFAPFVAELQQARGELAAVGEGQEIPTGN